MFADWWVSNRHAASFSSCPIKSDAPHACATPLPHNRRAPRPRTACERNYLTTGVGA